MFLVVHLLVNCGCGDLLVGNWRMSMQKAMSSVSMMKHPCWCTNCLRTCDPTRHRLFWHSTSLTKVSSVIAETRSWQPCKWEDTQTRFGWIFRWTPVHPLEQRRRSGCLTLFSKNRPLKKTTNRPKLSQGCCNPHWCQLDPRKGNLHRIIVWNSGEWFPCIRELLIGQLFVLWSHVCLGKLTEEKTANPFVLPPSFPDTAWASN